MVTLAEHHRIQGLHTRARELIEAAEGSRDYLRRQYLKDLASTHERVAAEFELQAEEKHVWGAKAPRGKLPPTAR